MAVADVLVPSKMNSFSFDYINAMNNLMDRSYDAGYGSQSESSTSPSPVKQPAMMTEELTAATAVDAELTERIRKQVEWYFSDENLQKDSFLMKHVTRNKQGYVSLKLVASLRKVKSLTKDWKVVLASVKDSTLLEVNEECTKIRRLTAAPKIDYSHLPKTLLITNYPHENPIESAINNEFSRYGNITRIMILHPGKSIPLDIKSCKSKHPIIGKEMCIIVEYSTAKEAKMAVQELSRNWRQTMHISILSVDAHLSTEDAKKISRPENNNRSIEGPHSSKNTAKVSSAKVSPVSRKITKHRIANGYDSGHGNSRSPSLSPMPSPAPSRRFFSEPSSQTRLPIVKPLGIVAVTVLRTPQGPDGTNGFH